VLLERSYKVPVELEQRSPRSGKENSGGTKERKSVTGAVFVGRILSAIALVCCVPVGTLLVSVATGAVGIMLGVVGYGLGACRLGNIAVALCTAAMFLASSWQSMARYWAPTMRC
jgi:hypothetical protein